MQPNCHMAHSICKPICLRKSQSSLPHPADRYSGPAPLTYVLIEMGRPRNALQDLWALMDFAQPGGLNRCKTYVKTGLLGNHATFTKRFNDPIEPLATESVDISVSRSCVNMRCLHRRWHRRTLGLRKGSLRDASASAVALKKHLCAFWPRSCFLSGENLGKSCKTSSKTQ